MAIRHSGECSESNRMLENSRRLGRESAHDIFWNKAQIVGTTNGSERFWKLSLRRSRHNFNPPDVRLANGRPNPSKFTER
jgi:hypothetical protein